MFGQRFLWKSARWNVLLLLMAVCIRAGLAPFSFHPWEGQTWLNVGHDLYEQRNPYETFEELSARASSLPVGTDGWVGFYEYIAYPPLWALIEFPFYALVAPEHVEFATPGRLPPALTPRVNAVLKLPIILFDLAIGVILFALAKMVGIKRPWLLVWLWLFNPLTIMISAVWGHFEPVVIFFTLASLWAFGKNRLNISAFLLALAILTKMYPILFIPIILHALVLKRGFRGVLSYVGVMGVTVGVVLAPFVVADVDALLTVISFHGARSGGGMTYYNIVWLLGSFDPMRSPLNWGLNFSNIYAPIMLWALAVTYLFIWKHGVASLSNVMRACALILLVFMATTKLVNEPYALWVLPFILLLTLKDSRFLWAVAMLTAIPIAFMLINVPFPLFFRPWVFEAPFGQQILELFFLPSGRKFIGLFALGVMFTFTSLVLATQIWRQWGATASFSEGRDKNSANK